MNGFIQHIPTFVETTPAAWIDFKTTQDLLSLGCIQRYSFQIGSWFVMSGNLLMQISQEGFHWWVIGHVRNPLDIDLPQWEGPKYYAELKDGTKKVLTRKVIDNVCGDVLTLTDGTTAKIIGRGNPLNNLIVEIGGSDAD